MAGTIAKAKAAESEEQEEIMLAGAQGIFEHNSPGIF